MSKTKLKPFDEMQHHPLTETIVDMLSVTTQTADKHMFRVMCSYYWGMLGTHMRAGIIGWFSDNLPVNIYAVCLAESGTGKGYTVNTMEKHIINQFRTVFMEETFPVAADDGMEDIATYRATKRGSAKEDERTKLQKEYDTAGNFLFQFSHATTAAIKQLRHKLVIANAGSLNYQVDEIGSNLIGAADELHTLLELYDRGDVKEKLIKNTAENTRFEALEGFTPTNMLLFGTSSSLLDGSETENKFMNLLASGYARRSFFSFSQVANKETQLTAEDIVEMMFNQHHEETYEEISDHLESLADVSNLDREITIDRDCCLYLVKYKLLCEQRARDLKSHQKILQAELQHRYFKVLKAAASFAFIDHQSEITIDYLENAMKLAEESGKQLTQLLNPEKDFMRLAKFICEQDEEVTIPDIELGLPCFGGSQARKQEMITNATAWGYKNNILITKRYVDQILFLQGETLEETNLDELFISSSDHEAYNYENEVVKFEDLAALGEVRYQHWVNHHLEDNHRLKTNVIKGFNLIVLDVDDGTPIEAAMRILEGIYAVYYDTKSSTAKHNRYRIVIPTNYILELDAEDYTEFMKNVLAALPFEVDSSVCEREHKWQTWDAGADVISTHTVGKQEVENQMFNVLDYIPRTSKNEERLKRVKDYGSLDGLQYWVMSTTAEGNRNRQLYRYAMILVDSGYDYDTIHSMVKQMNDSLKDGISDKEISNTIMSSVARLIQ